MTNFEPHQDPGPVPVGYANPSPGLIELTRQGSRHWRRPRTENSGGGVGPARSG